MTTIQVDLPENVAAQLKAEGLDKQELDSFLVAAIEAWLRQRQLSKGSQPSWAEAFQNSAIDFIDQFIDENETLFTELAQR